MFIFNAKAAVLFSYSLPHQLSWVDSPQTIYFSFSSNCFSCLHCRSLLLFDLKNIEWRQRRRNGLKFRCFLQSIYIPVNKKVPWKLNVGWCLFWLLIETNLFPRVRNIFFFFIMRGDESKGHRMCYGKLEV